MSSNVESAWFGGKCIILQLRVRKIYLSALKRKKNRGSLATSRILPVKCFVFLHLSCQDLAKLLECKRNCMLKQQQENQNGGVNQQGLDGENVLVLQEAEKFGSSLFSIRKKPSFIVFFQLRYSLKTSTCKFEIVNLSIISHALLGGAAPVPFFPGCTQGFIYHIGTRLHPFRILIHVVMITEEKRRVLLRNFT